MMKLKVKFILLSLVLVLSASCGSANPDFSSFVNKSKTYVNGDLMSSQTTYYKDGKFRSESVVDGKETVMIFDGNKYYMYFPKEKSAMTMSRMDNSQNLLDFNKIVGDEDKKIIGQEKVNGKNCEVSEVVINRQRTQVWVDKRTKLPVKTKVVAGRTEVITEYTSFKAGVNLNDSLFSLPEGTQQTSTGGLFKSVLNSMW
jgi:outer membrane lipoprotein-sorting protein